MSQRSPIVNFRTIDLNLLRVFDAVMAEGSLTRAAAVLSMTQPAASHALKRLHDTIGELVDASGTLQWANARNNAAATRAAHAAPRGAATFPATLTVRVVI